MIVFRDPSEVPADFGRSVVAIGKFDGVHVGHRAVIERMREDAGAIGARTVAVTFDRNPLEVLRPELCPENVVATERKIELLGELDLDATLVLTFDRALASLPAEDFVRDILVDALHAATILVGRDFRFGRGGAGDPALLQRMGPEHGFTVDVIDDVTPEGGERRVSSTWVRSCSPRVMSHRPPECSAVRSASPARWCTVSSADASSGSPRPTCRRRSTPSRPPMACTRGGWWITRRASGIPPRSRSAPTPRSTTSTAARSKPTSSMPPDSTSTVTG